MKKPVFEPYLVDGEKVPRTTDILKYAKDAGALMYWAWDQGRQGLDFRGEREKAATIGTMAHAAVEAHIRRRPFEWPTTPKTIVVPAKRAYGAFEEWASQVKLKVTHPECRLVSKRYRYGGTLDAPLIARKRAIGDWKTSKAVYWEYLVQLAAYGNLWNENFPDDPVEGGYHLVRFDKATGDFRHLWWGDLSEAWEAFLVMRKLWDLEKALKERVK